jgi:hypothetical protein
MGQLLSYLMVGLAWVGKVRNVVGTYLRRNTRPKQSNVIYVKCASEVLPP